MGAKVSGRPDIIPFFMKLAASYAERATCNRRKCSALFVRDKRLVVAGYNSSPSGQPHCNEVGCLMVNSHCLRCPHAEDSAICYAALQGIPIGGCDVFIHGGTPCARCALKLISVKARIIYYNEPYPDDVALQLLDAAHIPYIQVT